MPRILRTLACAAALLLGGLPAAPAQPTGARLVEGAGLILHDTLSSDITIAVDPSLANHLRLWTGGTLACVTATKAQDNVTVDTAACDEDAGDLRIEIPPGLPLQLTINDSGNIAIEGGTHAPLQATLNGSGDLSAGPVGALNLTIHHDGDAHIASVDGPAQLDMFGSGDIRLGSLHGSLVEHIRGSGDLAIGTIDAQAVTIANAGSGDTLIGGGRISSLSASLEGSGDLAVAADIHDADVTAIGDADAKLGRVDGVLKKRAIGNASIIVGGPDLISSIISQVAGQLGNGAPDSHVVVFSGVLSLITHIATALFAIAMLYVIWRIIRRSRATAATTIHPPHPGIGVLNDMLTRLEQRLGGVETYVTSREFDLHQKFKNL